MPEQPKNLGREPLEDISLGRLPLIPARRFTFVPDNEENLVTIDDEEGTDAE